MSGQRLSLILLANRLAICRLDGDAPLPDWAMRQGWFSITRTQEELSVVCPEVLVPESIRAERGYRALRIAVVLDLTQVGVLASLASPLAGAGISLFALSTFDTDYLLVKEQDLGRAVEVLVAAGHAVHGLDDRGTGSGSHGPRKSLAGLR
jgi:hypothetical protein